MQSITAMAHLRAVVLYIVDASEQCGYASNSTTFHSIKPLFLEQAARRGDQQDRRLRQARRFEAADAALIVDAAAFARNPASLVEGDDEDDTHHVRSTRRRFAREAGVLR